MEVRVLETTINERIKKLRTSLQKSQKDFGASIGIKPNSVSDIETGKNNVTEQNIKAICLENWGGKKVNEEWLRTGNGEMFEQLTDQEKILKYVALLLEDTDSVVANAIKTFIITYEQLDNISKEVLEKVALKYIENLKKSQ